MALPKANRLKDKKDFEEVFKKGNAVKGNFLLVKSKANGRPFPRYAIIISTKTVANAVNRNRIKRVLMEVVKREMVMGKKGVDTVIIVNKKGEEEALILDLIGLLSKN